MQGKNFDFVKKLMHFQSFNVIFRFWYIQLSIPVKYVSFKKYSL